MFDQMNSTTWLLGQEHARELGAWFQHERQLKRCRAQIVKADGPVRRAYFRIAYQLGKLERAILHRHAQGATHGDVALPNRLRPSH